MKRWRCNVRRVQKNARKTSQQFFSRFWQLSRPLLRTLVFCELFPFYANFHVESHFLWNQSVLISPTWLRRKRLFCVMSICRSCGSGRGNFLSKVLTRWTAVLRKRQRHKDSNELMFTRAWSTVVAEIDYEIFHSECSSPNKMAMGGEGWGNKTARGWGRWVNKLPMGGGEIIKCLKGEVVDWNVRGGRWRNEVSAGGEAIAIAMTPTPTKKGT